MKKGYHMSILPLLGGFFKLLYKYGRQWLSKLHPQLKYSLPKQFIQLFVSWIFWIREVGRAHGM